MNMKILVLIAAVCWCFPAAARSESAPIEQDNDVIAIIAKAKFVSLIQLIAAPEKYDGSIVGVMGFVKMEFEGDAVYLSEIDYKYGVYKNALWIDITDAIRKDINKFNKQYCLVIGTFNSANKGYQNLFSGEIKVVKIIESKGERNDYNGCRQAG